MDWTEAGPGQGQRQSLNQPSWAQTLTLLLWAVWIWTNPLISLVFCDSLTRKVLMIMSILHRGSLGEHEKQFFGNILLKWRIIHLFLLFSLPLSGHLFLITYHLSLFPLCLLWSRVLDRASDWEQECFGSALCSTTNWTFVCHELGNFLIIWKRQKDWFRKIKQKFDCFQYLECLLWRRWVS